MTRLQARGSAREILKIVPLVMRTVAAELRASGELPAPAHFRLLTMLSQQPRTLTELAALLGVSLPTMSNSISAMVQRGWVRRTSPTRDRRVVIIEVTPTGKAAVERVGRCAEIHLAESACAARSGGAASGCRPASGVLQDGLRRRPPQARRTSTGTRSYI